MYNEICVSLYYILYKITLDDFVGLNLTDYSFWTIF